jgi:hypothetical protein
VKKPYFFGYLFVRGAKIFAFLVILAGIGFCVLQYSQANTAVAAVAYQSSSNLEQALRKLTDVLSATEQFVISFSYNNKDNPAAPVSIGPPNFPEKIESNADFARVRDELVRIDQERQRLKASIVSRFENSVATIEDKLHAYAAGLEASSPMPPAAGPSPEAAADLRSLASQPDSLFSSGLDVDELNKRSAGLSQRKEFLKSLASKAESPENKTTLNEAANQLDELSKLLPEKSAVLSAAQLESANAAAKEPPLDAGRKVFLSERIATQLGQLRGDVRQVLLTSWVLDDAFDQAAELNSVEREKCRVATLAEKGIWLSSISKMLPGLFAAVALSFLVLVFADLVRTLLDTAAHTGTVADAINSLRGSVAHLSESEPIDLSESEPIVKNDDRIPMVEEEASPQGGS